MYSCMLILISHLFFIHELPQTFAKVNYLHNWYIIVEWGTCGLEELALDDLNIGASLLSGGHVAWSCLHLMICILVYHCWGWRGGG